MIHSMVSDDTDADTRGNNQSKSNTAARNGAKSARERVDKMLVEPFTEQDVLLLYANLRAACKQRGGFHRNIRDAKLDADAKDLSVDEVLDRIRLVLQFGVPGEADRPVLRNYVLKLHEKVRAREQEQQEEQD